MIQSRPKGTTLFSLILFLIIAYGIGIWAWFSAPRSPSIWLALPIICLVVALLISIKVLLGYRVITIKGDQWRVARLISRDLRFTGKDIEWWREIEIKTAGGTYKQLHVHAGKGVNAKVSLQEHTAYQQVLNRLKTKHRQKQVKDIN
jgi:hypothetical protein